MDQRELRMFNMLNVSLYMFYFAVPHRPEWRDCPLSAGFDFTAMQGDAKKVIRIHFIGVPYK